MAYEILKKSFIYFYERKFVVENDFDRQIMQNLCYQLQAVGVDVDEDYSFLLEEGKVHSLELAYLLRQFLQSEETKANETQLSYYAYEKLLQLKKLKNIIVYSKKMKSYFSAKELEEEEHILYWMNVVSSADYINKGKAVTKKQTLDILNKYFLHSEINNIALEKSNSLEKILVR